MADLPSTGDHKRIVLDLDDFAEPAAAAAPPPDPAPPAGLPSVAAGPPLKLGAPHPPAHGYAASSARAPAGSLLNHPLVAPILAALAGIALSWAVTEVLGLPNLGVHATSASELDADSGLWTAALGVLFCSVVVAFDRAVAGAMSEAGSRALRGALPAAACSFVAGFVAQAVYITLLEHGDLTNGKVYLSRMIAWGLFGAGVGSVFGLVDKAGKRAVNGAIGGAIGGAVGGAIFQYLGSGHVHSEALARLLGLAAVAVLIALAVRTVEAARREAWLRVIAGGMTGKEFILYHAVTRLGSAPDCEIFMVKDPTVAKVHARIEEQAGHRVLTAVDGSPVYVNSTPIQSQRLANGDQVQIGNTVMSYAERALAQPAPV